MFSADIPKAVLKSLLRSRFDQHNRVTPLILCVKFGHHELAALLLASGATHSINFTERHGATALVTGAGYGQTRCIALLLACRQTDVYKQDEGGRTPLDWASMNGHITSLILLLRHDLSIPFHALFCAVRKGRLLAIAILCIVTYARCWLLALLCIASQIESLFSFFVRTPFRLLSRWLGAIWQDSKQYVTQRRASMHIHVNPTHSQSAVVAALACCASPP